MSSVFGVGVTPEQHTCRQKSSCEEQPYFKEESKTSDWFLEEKQSHHVMLQFNLAIVIRLVGTEIQLPCYLGILIQGIPIMKKKKKSIHTSFLSFTR